MPVINEKFTITTKGFTDIIDITRNVKAVIDSYKIKDGQVMVYVMGSTASITTIEYEPGLIKDFPEALEKIAPMDKEYHHNEKWHDGNGYAHVRAAFIGNSAIFPLIDTALQVGTWQQIVLVDFDNKPRTRNVTVQVVY